MGFMFDQGCRRPKLAGDHVGGKAAAGSGALRWSRSCTISPSARHLRNCWASRPHARGLLCADRAGVVRHEQHGPSPFRRAELDRFAAATRTRQTARHGNAIRPVAQRRRAGSGHGDAELLENRHSVQHEQIKADMRSGRIGLAQNRLPVTSRIEDVHEDELVDFGHSDAAQRQMAIWACRRWRARRGCVAGGRRGGRWTHSGRGQALHRSASWARTARSSGASKGRLTSRLRDAAAARHHDSI